MIFKLIYYPLLVFKRKLSKVAFFATLVVNFFISYFTHFTYILVFVCQMIAAFGNDTILSLTFHVFTAFFMSIMAYIVVQLCGVPS